MADNGEIKIPIFDGEDYAMWKKRLTMSLKLKKCALNIERAKTDKEGEEWDAKEVKAISLIYNGISNKQMEFINDEETAYDMIKKFDSLYLKESTALQIVYRNKLEKIKLKNYNDASTFFSDFEKCINDLKSAGAKITEREKLNYILNTLPESYSYIGDLIDVLKEEEQTAEYVKSKILMKEIKMQKEENYKPRSNAFMSDRRKCFKCGKVGHIQRDCKNGDQNASGSSTWPSTRDRGTHRGRGNRGRGRGQRGMRTHQAEQEGEQKEDNRAWIARVDCNTAQKCKFNNNNNVCEINWLLDSGCTDHITLCDSDFILLWRPSTIFRYSKTKKNGIGEISNTPPKSRFMAIKPFFSRLM